jgi:hypothetical protein
MTAISDRLRELRGARRRTIQALSSLGAGQLLAHVGPARNANVRATLLILAQDDDQRRITLKRILAGLRWSPNEAQRVPGSLALTRAQVRAAIVGLSDEEFDEPAAPGEWAVRQALEHVMNNERQFRIDAEWAIHRLHSTEELPVQKPGERQGAGTLPAPIPGGLEAVLEALEAVRDESVALIADLTDEELAAPAVWVGTPVDVRFLALRRAGHEREHVVQIHKTLQAIGRPHSEAELILAQAEVARGALEGDLLRSPDDLLGQRPGHDLPSIEQLLREAGDQEEARVAAILNAVS